MPTGLVFLLVVFLNLNPVVGDHFDVVEAFGFEKMRRFFKAVIRLVHQNRSRHIPQRVFAALPDQPVPLAFLRRNLQLQHEPLVNQNVGNAIHCIPAHRPVG
jgi:hypothetical protein